MAQWRQEKRGDVAMVDIEALVPKEHLLRKIERIRDYDWLYERLSPLYCHDNGRNGTDPVVLVKMVLLRHLYGIASLRQTHQRIMDTLSYRKALNNRVVDPSMIFIDGTHIKTSANKKKFQKEQVVKVAKIYSEELRREVNAEREQLRKKPIEDEDDDADGGATVEKTVSF